MSTLRRLARSVAKANMKKAGMRQICKSGRKHGETRGYSWFARNWKEWAKK